jgi:hypothetical protein
MGERDVRQDDRRDNAIAASRGQAAKQGGSCCSCHKCEVNGALWPTTAKRGGTWPNT